MPAVLSETEAVIASVVFSFLFSPDNRLCPTTALRDCPQLLHNTHTHESMPRWRLERLADEAAHPLQRGARRPAALPPLLPSSASSALRARSRGCIGCAGKMEGWMRFMLSTIIGRAAAFAGAAASRDAIHLQGRGSCWLLP